jgi:hypothetical protein
LEQFDFRLETVGSERDLVQVQLWPPSQGHEGRRFALWTDLRFGEQDMSIVGWDVTAHINRAELKLTLEGCECVKGSLFGDDPQPDSWVVQETEVTDSAAQRSGKASAALHASVAEGISVRVF